MNSVGEQVDSSRLAAMGRELSNGVASGAAPGDYFQALLRLIHETLTPQSATVWGVNEHGVLEKIAEISRRRQRVAEDAAAVLVRTNRLLDALNSTDLQVRSAKGQNAAEATRTHVELLAPFANEARPCGVIEVVISAPDLLPTDVERAKAVMVEFARYASRYVSSQWTKTIESKTAQFADRLHQVIFELHRDPSVNHVSLTAVNEGRALLGCDRLSLAAQRGNRTEILAVSGQERIVTRSNLIQAMSDLATVLIAAEKPFRCDGNMDIVPPQLREPLTQYMKESGARCIEAYPLRKLHPSAGDQEDSPRFESCGLLLGEYFQLPTTIADPALAHAFSIHLAMALANARLLERNSTPARWLLRQFFGPAEFKKARHAAMTLAVALAAVAALGMTPVTYRVEAPGRLMPFRRSELFAPLDGRVAEVLVDSNEVVSKGQVLLRLQNDRLTTEILTTRHQLHEQQQLLATLEAQRAELLDQRSGHDSIRLSGAVLQARIELSSIERRLRALEAEASELDVRAPLTGTVTTFDPRRVLLNRPVQRGESLLEVMDTDGVWELELDLPAKRVGQVLRAQSAAGAAAVPVQFTLVSQPETAFEGALRTVSSRIVAGPGAEPVAPTEVNIAVREIAHPVAGTDVVARIDCGKQPLGWVLFGDVVDFFRRRLW